MRRIFSSVFAWLEDEDFIVKSPVRRIHRVRTESLVKEVLTDENMEVLRDSCQEIRDIAMIDLLASTGMRVGELVNLNREDIDFHERQCVVFGKGNKEREVYFNARTKIHLQNYLSSRTDDNPALFVSLSNPRWRFPPVAWKCVLNTWSGVNMPGNIPISSGVHWQLWPLTKAPQMATIARRQD